MSKESMSKEQEEFQKWWDENGTSMADYDAALLGWQAARQQAPAEHAEPVVYWALFDNTGGPEYIKKDASDGTLAFFDSEAGAQRAKRRYPGTDYKRVEYYTGQAWGEGGHT